MLAPLTLTLLGAPALTVGEQPLPALAAIDAALLAVLALQGAQPRQQVAAWLWPKADSAGAATNLRQRIYRLKRLAGRGVVEGDRSIALPADLRHDLQGYAEQLARDPQHGRGALLGALDFPGHEALSVWLSAQREALARTRVRVLAKVATEHAAQGRLAAALESAQSWLHHAPVDEPAHRLHIQLLYQQGNRAGALAAYQQCEQHLRAELGVAPSADTRALLAQLQQGAAPTQAAPSPLPLALLRPPRLVARDEPWRQLAQAAAARRALVLEGEAGLGKSRLLGDFVAGRDGWCLVAASPGDSVLPLALMARVLSACMARWGRPDEDWVCRELARLAPEAGTPSVDAFATLRLQQAVHAALVHWQQHGLEGLALDDLHHADPSSLALLLPLASSSETTGLPWLLATRPPAAAGLDSLPRLALQPLSLDEVQQFLSSLGLAGVRHDLWVPWLLQRTGGNPLYLLQTLTAAHEADALAADTPPLHLAAPASLSALLAARLGKLSPQARAIARLASVAGIDFTPQLACLLLQLTPASMADPWLELQTAHVMQGGGFAHDLIREACALITPPEVRSLMHAQVAQALQDRHGPAARVAEHWDAAGRWPEAAIAYEQAADLAHERSAVADELIKLRAASRCHRASTHGHSVAAAFATELRALHLQVANNELGNDTLQGSEALLAQARTDEQRAAAQVQLAYYWAERFEPERALPWAQAALELASTRGLERQALLAAQRLAGALSRLGRHDEALLCLRPLSLRLHVLTRDERLNWRSDFGSVLDYADHRREALQVFNAVVDEATEHGRLSVAADALSLSSNVLAYLGRTHDSLRACEQALRRYRGAGLDHASLLVNEANQLGALRDLGHFDTYLARAEQLPPEMRAAGSEFWAANSEHDLATAYAWLGRADLALRTLSAQRLEQLPPLMQGMRLVTRARLARDFGVGAPGANPRALLQEAQALLATVQTAGRSHFNLAIGLQVARDAEPQEALATATQLEAEGLRRENMILACSASGVRLRLLMASGDETTACEVAAQLLQRLDTFGPPPGVYPPELWWLAHQALRERRPAAAQAALVQAVQWVRQRAHAHVPEHHRESFLARNPINRAVLAAAQVLGL